MVYIVHPLSTYNLRKGCESSNLLDVGDIYVHKIVKYNTSNEEFIGPDMG